MLTVVGWRAWRRARPCRTDGSSDPTEVVPERKLDGGVKFTEASVALRTERKSLNLQPAEYTRLTGYLAQPTGLPGATDRVR